MTKGSIPKKITIISNGTITLLNDKIDVVPAFVADSLSKNSIETGKRWANRRNTYNKNTNPNSLKNIKEEERDNTPLSNIILTGLDYRSEGGRAYKIITEDNYYFDFREDVLLDVIKNSEIIKGLLKGEFIWGKVGSQMKIIRVGSSLYDSLVEGSKKVDLKQIKPVGLKIGGLYENKAGVKSVFLGFVSTLEVNSTIIDNRRRIFSVKKIPKIMLWWRHQNYYKEDPAMRLNDFIYGKSIGYTYDLELKLSCSVINEIKVLDIPQPIIDLIKNKVIERVGTVNRLPTPFDSRLINMIRYDGSEPELNPMFDFPIKRVI